MRKVTASVQDIPLVAGGGAEERIREALPGRTILVHVFHDGTVEVEGLDLDDDDAAKIHAALAALQFESPP